MTNKIIPNNSLCEFNSAKLRSTNLQKIQPLFLSSSPILNNNEHHITPQLLTNHID